LTLSPTSWAIKPKGCHGNETHTADSADAGQPRPGGGIGRAALGRPTQWTTRQPGHYQVLYLAQDLRNGGIAGSYRAFATAAALLGWQLQVIDGKGSSALLRQALASAIEQRRVQG
jgi:hypothetical protein